jgi:hypothetical protein
VELIPSITPQLMTDNGKALLTYLELHCRGKLVVFGEFCNWNITKTQEQLLHTGNVYVSTSGLPQSIENTNSKDSK